MAHNHNCHIVTFGSHKSDISVIHHIHIHHMGNRNSYYPHLRTEEYLKHQDYMMNSSTLLTGLTEDQVYILDLYMYACFVNRCRFDQRLELFCTLNTSLGMWLWTHIPRQHLCDTIHVPNKNRSRLMKIPFQDIASYVLVLRLNGTNIQHNPPVKDSLREVEYTKASELEKTSIRRNLFKSIYQTQK